MLLGPKSQHRLQLLSGQSNALQKSTLEGPLRKVDDMDDPLGIWKFRPRVLGKRLFYKPHTDSVIIGTTEDGRYVFLFDKQRKPGFYVIGEPGAGKSVMATSMIIQDLIRDHQVLVFDPGGSIASYVRAFRGYVYGRESQDVSIFPSLAKAQHERVEQWLDSTIMLDFGEKDFGYTYNPLEVRWEKGETASDVANAFIQCLDRLVGGMDQMRRLRALLHASCCLVALQGGTPMGIINLVSESGDSLRALIYSLQNQAQTTGREVPRSCSEHMLTHYTTLSPREKREQNESLKNLLLLLFTTPEIVKFFNAPGGRGSLDFDAILNGDSPKNVIVHLPLSGGDSVRFLGAILLNALQRAIYARHGKYEHLQKRLVTCYLDEHHQFIDTQLPDFLAQCRKYGARLALLHQAGQQPPLYHTPEGQGLLSTIRGICPTKCVMRVGLEDARALAGMVLVPKGLRVKREVHEETHSHSVGTSEAKARAVQVGASKSISLQRSYSEALSVTKSISESISKALANATTKSYTTTDSNGVSDTISVTQGKGVTRTKSKNTGLTVMTGDSWSQVESKSSGMTITIAKGKAYAHATGSARGESEAISKGTGSAQSKGTSSGRSEGNSNYSSEGMNVTPTPQQMMGDGQLVTLPSSTGLTNGLGEGRSTSYSDTESESNTKSSHESFTRGLSRVKNWATSTGHNRQESQGDTHTLSIGSNTGQSLSRAESESLTEGLSWINNYSQSVAQACSRSHSEAHGKTEGTTTTTTTAFALSTAESASQTWAIARTEAEAQSWSRSLSFSKTHTEAKSTAKTTKVELYTLQEEIELNAQKLQCLAPRMMYVSTKEYRETENGFPEGELKAVLCKTVDMPMQLPTVFNGVDYAELLQERELERRKNRALQQPNPPQHIEQDDDNVLEGFE